MANYRQLGLYSATDIANELGVSTTFVGKVANIFGLKSDEYAVKAGPTTYLYSEKGKNELARIIDIITRYENGRKINAKKRQE